MTEASNPAERRRWNDARWTTVWPKRERLTDTVTPHLLDTAAIAAGERVLDIGCGGGKTAIAAARRTGPQGAVVGADLSAALGDLARQRARDAGVDNLSVETVDMQHATVPGGPFDVAISQFGVMFFDEPVTAFTNIARHLRANGRIAFACWRSVDENPWHAGPAVANFLPAPPTVAEGKAPTGPFALADAARTTGILAEAGFAEIRRTPLDLTVDGPADSVADEDQLAFMGVADSDMPAARAALDAGMSRFRLDGELYRFPLALQIFAARRA